MRVLTTGKPRQGATIATAGGAAFALTSCAAPSADGLPLSSILRPASPDALAIANLWWFVFVIMALVSIGVTVATLYAASRFRARPEREHGEIIYGSTPLELAWTIAPIAVLVVVFAIAMWVMQQVDAGGENPGQMAQAAEQPLRVQAIGNLWWWEFRFPDLGVSSVNELHLPVGRPVEVELVSEDVIHSFWIPQLHGKRDMVPGQVNHLTFTPTEVGELRGICAEFCGVQHAWMYFQVFVEPAEQFDAWVAEQLTPARPPDTQVAQHGQEIFLTTTCQSCHLVRGVGGVAGVGPELTHMGSREFIGAGILENTPENMARWLRAPQEVKPGNLMPNNPQLTDEEIQALTAYLESLR